MIAKSHFDDCPYGCNQNGMLLDAETKKMVQCPHCSQKKKELLREGYAISEKNTQVPLNTLLGISSKYLTEKFVYDTIIPEGERLFIEDESLKWQSEESEELYLGLTVGELPEESLCFGISIKGRVDRFAYPMLAKAYLNGISVGKFISSTEFNRLQFNMDESLDDFYNADLLFMLINEGSTRADIFSAKGLMQARALRGKPTIFVTTWTIEACSELLGFQEEGSYFLARPVFVQYKTNKNAKKSRYINNLLGVENEQVDSGDEDNDKGVYMADLFKS